MNLRFASAISSLAAAAMVAAMLVSTIAWADGPGYTYIGASYEWTDVKYGVNPSEDLNFNNGKIEGLNLDASLGILDWMHVTGQFFSGDCISCGNIPTVNGTAKQDMPYTGWKAGLGFNIGFDTIGWNEDTDLVLRANYIDVSLINPGQANTTGDGWSTEILVRSQISERAEVMAGYEYTQIDYNGLGYSSTDTTKGTIKNSDIVVGIAYRVGYDIALTGNAIVFDNDTGFSLGIRWYFGSLAFNGRDSIVR
jgi:hypothetical protein